MPPFARERIVGSGCGRRKLPSYGPGLSFCCFHVVLSAGIGASRLSKGFVQHETARIFARLIVTLRE